MGTEIKPPVEEQSEKAPPERKSRSRKRSIIIFAVISLVNAGLLALLWIALLTPASNSNQNGSGTGSASDPLLGKPAPNFTLSVLNKHGGSGSVIHLADLTGKPVVLNFWASWCAPCKEEAPLFKAEWQRAQAQGVVFIGIDYQDRQSDGLSFLQQEGITYTNVMDADGSTAINYGVTGVPETFFIDRSGKIITTVRKEITAAQLQSDVALLK